MEHIVGDGHMEAMEKLSISISWTLSASIVVMMKCFMIQSCAAVQLLRKEETTEMILKNAVSLYCNKQN